MNDTARDLNPKHNPAMRRKRPGYKRNHFGDLFREDGVLIRRVNGASRRSQRSRYAI